MRRVGGLVLLADLDGELGLLAVFVECIVALTEVPAGRDANPVKHHAEHVRADASKHVTRPLDDTVRMRDENPSIGIIVCKSKDKTIVEYALRESKKPMGVGTYQMVSRLPEELKDELPSPEQVAGLLEEIG